MRRAAVVHTMLQASVQLSLCAMYSSCIIRSLKNQNVQFSSDILVSTYSRSTYMHIIRTCTIGRSTYIRYYFFADLDMSSLDSSST